MGQEQAVNTLRPGTRFYMLLETTGCKLYGTLVQTGTGSALVEWEPYTRTLLDETQEIPRHRNNISLDTQVIACNASERE